MRAMTASVVNKGSHTASSCKETRRIRLGVLARCVQKPIEMRGSHNDVAAMRACPDLLIDVPVPASVSLPLAFRRAEPGEASRSSPKQGGRRCGVLITSRPAVVVPTARCYRNELRARASSGPLERFSSRSSRRRTPHTASRQRAFEPLARLPHSTWQGCPTPTATYNKDSS